MVLHLDHIIILVPYPTLLNPPSWITDNFTISPGGTHADLKTANKLVIFHDGSYLELISFIDDLPSNREGHWWGTKKYGVIDFAFTDSTGDANIQYSQLQERLDVLNAKEGGKKVEYKEPVAGGRKRPDGEDVKWKVTFPVLDGEIRRQRGELPFFCHDVTERKMRVPLEEKNFVHPCGAVGIEQMSLSLYSEKFPEIAEAYEAILGVENKDKEKGVGSFTLGRLHKVDRPDPVFHVWVPALEWQDKAMEERSGLLIGDLVFDCGSGEVGRQRLHRIDPEDGYMGGVYLFNKK